MTFQQSSWTKTLLAVVISAYALALLVFVIIASHSRIGPTPAITLEPPPITEPPDFKSIKNTDERKQAFFGFIRPLVAYENAYYRQEREYFQVVADKIDAEIDLDRSEERKLKYWADKLFLEDDLSLEEQVEILRRRLNTIPEAMVLAQAAAESAWGQSRFARQANNYFGQWCYTAGCGLVPNRRNVNATHEVRNFDSALDAVRAYFLNINTHRAYRALRDKRLALEQAGEDITGYVLVGELGQYSERGQHYIDELRLIIRGNHLE